MPLKERKAKFTKLLQNLLEERGGIKSKLAGELAISPARFSNWLQGKVDPAALDLVSFKQIAKLKGCSIDYLVEILDLIEEEQSSLDKFRSLLSELLLNLTQEQLADRLGVNQGTISRWLSPDNPTDLKKISVTIMFSLAKEKKWTLEKLFNYLRLEQDNKKDHNALVNTYTKTKHRDKLHNRNVCIILEKEDLAIATNYASNLVLHLNLKPENIKVTTIPKLPESIADIDILMFDLSSPSSANISLIEDIEFDRDIVVFANADLPVEVRSHLESKVTDVVVKPIDWQELKDKAYFS